MNSPTYLPDNFEGKKNIDCVLENGPLGADFNVASDHHMSPAKASFVAQVASVYFGE
jgi:hypothetical protein